MKNLDPILLLEDDQIDALTVKRAFKDIQINNELIHLENGEEGLNFLRKLDQKPPCIILLDLNMPKMNGIEFLQEVKNDPKLKSIPIIVLTTSGEEKDRKKSFENSVAGYIIKPVEYNEFVLKMQTFKDYWYSNELP